MAAQGRIFKSFVSLFSGTSQTAPVKRDEEQLFLASIAHLSPDEQRPRIQRRAMYRRMVQRQGIMEVEQHATNYGR